MKQTVNLTNFRDAFGNCQYKDQFSYSGLGALFDYLEERESDTGQEEELDTGKISAEFAEYESLEEYNENYGKECETLEDVRRYTTVIPIEGTESFIIEQH